ncbi:Mandelate racemase/muconate lactonizing protein OS=Tsukamurella paurometabola (strain ATCC 8368 /DSM / CCUG 35730 / CIP 100753 / JCM 10117 / KCTC 9821/ NBRC 16120 / NCIMB 702349 / NCTC 13040) OX=521096 GN=Tpau_2700 PE=3 SV=1 [Tsukamurella paurometabola]|uniref:Mandelate racemase/muconate lactonizing protein n=1 Tax=Tsukamurella paurometabola (strain ATCC 8368 / DSM 20162 / CCUG 35730 / CIP 100753 / JCM 10117 / KCTC 9821 / NBRC 16120 / NCIMB 702349 / NCTC 13040) TaxID=521096 RepID=D5USM8_TSUPD|nr:enolase C-terminal domain-like protein [Tsukamurella paurometabola]ADG79299.1 Mandelate racemase/muconate lactonizing protein [Tsukamurella paurometabola DSM 20162]SUP34975.1 L-Ala-D/L-Glu epimerase [Tsukamurella paurometabola]
MIERIDVAIAEIGFRTAFSHATKTRRRSASVLVTVHTEDGEIGWGEAAPRPYVTGEDIDTVIAILTAWRPEELTGMRSGDFGRDLTALSALNLTERLGGVRGHATAAAVETALLDALCRRHDRSMVSALSTALGTAPAAGFGYTTTIDLTADIHRAVGALPRKRAPHIKIKADRDVAAAAYTARLVRRLRPDATISVDANNSWALADVLAEAATFSDAGIGWLEEPLAARDWSGLRTLGEAGLPVMLDESFCGPDDLATSIRFQAATHMNVRVSKVGGPLRAAAAIRDIRAGGLDYQIGVQVGEVGPLWATGRALAAVATDAAAVEVGRQDEWFAQPLTSPGYHVDREHGLAAPVVGSGHGVRPTAWLSSQLTPAVGWTLGDGWTTLSTNSRKAAR